MAIDKAVDSAQLDADLTSVANAIRTKGGTSGALAFPAGFVSAIQNIPTGGGGASNIVTGTFNGTTTGAAIDITLPYTGTGYPIVFAIFPTEGPYNSEAGNFYSLRQRYAFGYYCGIKNQSGTAPTYPSNTSSNENVASVVYRYKSSATSATSRSTGQSDASFAYSSNGASTSNNYVVFKSATKMSVYIASTSYGFAANIEYTYYVIYSS